MPSSEALNSMSQLIAQCDWDKLQYPDHRAQVMTLALANEHNSVLDAMEGHLDNMVKQGEEVKTLIESLDAELSHISLWFEKSRLWEGRMI